MTFLKINNLSIEYKMRKETVNAAKNITVGKIEKIKTLKKMKVS